MREDWRTAPVEERVRSALGMLETLTLRPESFGPEALAPMREQGHDRRAMEDAISVATTFACAVRVADSLGFPRPNARSNAFIRMVLLGREYAPEAFAREGKHRYRAGWDTTRRDVLETAGDSDPALRRRLFDWIVRDATTADAALDELPTDLHTLVRKASRTAYKVTDEDIDALVASRSQPEVFELIATIGTAAGWARYDIGIRALDALDG